jgi:hypothetical protein
MFEAPKEDLQVVATARGLFRSKLLALKDPNKAKDPTKAKPAWRLWIAALVFLGLLVLVTVLAA